MRPPLIAKLIAPRPSQIVRRARVRTAIGRGLRTGACWITAPAGYGKTIAVAEYLQETSAPCVWYRVDEGDQDVATFFHYMAQSVRGVRRGGSLPRFGAEYADQRAVFTRRFFRSYFEKLRPGTVLVLDDLHYADVPNYQEILAILLQELPPAVRCACVSRSLPPQRLTELVRDKLTIVDEAMLRFTDREGLALVRTRLGRALTTAGIAPACGWAAGLVLLAERASTAAVRPETLLSGTGSNAPAAFAALAGQLIDSLPQPERDLLMKISLLPEVRPEIVRALGGTGVGQNVLDALYRRQLLVTRAKSSQTVFHLHDLLREYLRNRLVREWPAAERSALMAQAAQLLNEAGHGDSAIDLALQSQEWPVARRLISAQAATLLAQGRYATLVERCAALPPDELDAWLCFWLGVATVADDATAESWFTRAWAQFVQDDDARGLCLTAAHAVLAKADSWRTHEGLAVWTSRAIALLGREVVGLSGDEQLLAWTGMLRAVDFAAVAPDDMAAVERLARRLAERIARPREGDTATRRLLASEALVEHAGLIGQRDLFERAVDSVAVDLRDPEASPWSLGLWLVAFGAISGRYFPYSRRGFPYASPEDALRGAIAIGQRESLRGVEFGGLYHLQLQMKSRNDFTEFEALIKRLAEIADSRYTTQVAVLADCQAALHTLRRDFTAAHAACDRFMTAIEAANEPPLERWPHFITLFQVWLAERKPAEAAGFLADLLPLFSGAARQRTETCVRVARACEARWTGDPRYPTVLRECVEMLRASNWPAALLNVPDLLAEICGDALELQIEPEFCRSFIARRMLVPPAGRPARWPWPLRVHLLGEFRLELDGLGVDFGSKPPTRSLDIVRALAIAKDHTCALHQIYDSLWPDADGDQAKAACEQALHRLRRLLGRADLIERREGGLRLAPDKVWVDLDDWEAKVERVQSGEQDQTSRVASMERVVAEFPGPPRFRQTRAVWWVPVSERIRGSFIEIVLGLGRSYETHRNHPKACEVYVRGLGAYPTSERCYEALLRARLEMGDAAGALEDYYRCERVLSTTRKTGPSPAIRALVARLLPANAVSG